MKRKFPVIKNIYVVDKEAKISGEDLLYNHITGAFPEKYLEGSDKHHWKIVATIGEENRLGELPVIEFEREIDTLLVS